MSHCTEVPCPGAHLPAGESSGLTCLAVHAEANALLQAGGRTDLATLYCTLAPCTLCARMILNTTIKRLVLAGRYSDDAPWQMLRAAGLEVVFANPV